MKKDPIIIKSRSSSRYIKYEEPVLLHPNGHVTCGGYNYTYKRKTVIFKQYYEYMHQYLKKKKRKMDVSSIYERDLGDIVEELISKKQKSITTNKLRDIWAKQGQIAAMRRVIIETINKSAARKFRRKYNQLLKEDPKKARAFYDKYFGG